MLKFRKSIIEANTDLLLEVKLEYFIPSMQFISTAKDNQIFLHVELKREIGNSLYSEGNFEKCIQTYSKFDIFHNFMINRVVIEYKYYLLFIYIETLKYFHYYIPFVKQVYEF